jgi:hypothetical protein
MFELIAPSLNAYITADVEKVLPKGMDWPPHEGKRKLLCVALYPRHNESMRLTGTVGRGAQQRRLTTAGGG